MELKFLAPPQGVHALTLLCMSGKPIFYRLDGQPCVCEA